MENNYMSSRPNAEIVKNSPASLQWGINTLLWSRQMIVHLFSDTQHSALTEVFDWGEICCCFGVYALLILSGAQAFQPETWAQASYYHFWLNECRTCLFLQRREVELGDGFDQNKPMHLQKYLSCMADLQS